MAQEYAFGTGCFHSRHNPVFLFAYITKRTIKLTFFPEKKKKIGPGNYFSENLLLLRLQRKNQMVAHHRGGFYIMPPIYVSEHERIMYSPVNPSFILKNGFEGVQIACVC